MSRKCTLTRCINGSLYLRVAAISQLFTEEQDLVSVAVMRWSLEQVWWLFSTFSISQLFTEEQDQEGSETGVVVVLVIFSERKYERKENICLTHLGNSLYVL